MKEGLEVDKAGKVKVTIIVLVTLIETEKLIIHGLGNACACQTVMPKKYHRAHSVVMSVKNLKVAVGQRKIYIRPVQKLLFVVPLISETSSFSSSVLKEKCVYCLKDFTLQSLRAHVLTCLSSSYLSDDDTEDSAPPNVEPFVSNENNSQSNRSR